MYDCVIKTRDIFSFLPLINNSVTIEFSFLLLIISAMKDNQKHQRLLVFYFLCQDYNDQYF